MINQVQYFTIDENQACQRIDNFLLAFFKRQIPKSLIYQTKSNTYTSKLLPIKTSISSDEKLNKLVAKNPIIRHMIELFDLEFVEFTN